MAKEKRIFISTAIPYVNAAPHVGFALEYAYADAIARARRLEGHSVFFLSGTDENALKNVQAAEAANMPVKEFVAQNAGRFKELGAALEISLDDYIETASDPRHAPGAEKLWRAAAKDIYKKSYKGLYCVGCEEFKTDKDLYHGECPEHPGKKLEVVEEENYFFNLKKYEKQLHELISSDTLRIYPESRKNEMLRFIERGLEDFSISRSVERAHGWGVPVPGDSAQIQYVWFDALSNYINALGYADGSEKFDAYWTNADEIIHVIGKGIIRFHALYWPAMLLSAGVRLPTTLFVHGYITSGGQKMSKSLGNVISPFDLLDEYGPEALRYFFYREMPSFDDGDLTAERFHDAYTAHLTNGVGNLTSRILKMSEQHLPGPITPEERTIPQDFFDALDAFNIQRAAEMVWARVAALDVRIAEERPFALVKTDVGAAHELIQELAHELYTIARMLQPLLPTTSEKIKAAVKANKKPDNLFPRI